MKRYIFLTAGRSGSHLIYSGIHHNIPYNFSKALKLTNISTYSNNILYTYPNFELLFTQDVNSRTFPKESYCFFIQRKNLVRQAISRLLTNVTKLRNIEKKDDDYVYIVNNTKYNGVESKNEKGLYKIDVDYDLLNQIITMESIEKIIKIIKEFYTIQTIKLKSLSINYEILYMEDIVKQYELTLKTCLEKMGLELIDTKMYSCKLSDTVYPERLNEILKEKENEFNLRNDRTE